MSGNDERLKSVSISIYAEPEEESRWKLPQLSDDVMMTLLLGMAALAVVATIFGPILLITEQTLLGLVTTTFAATYWIWFYYLTRINDER